MSHIGSVPFKVLTTLSAYRIVSAVSTTANTVDYPSSASAVIIGITTDTVKDTTNAIPVCISGIARCYMNDTVTSGKLVASDSSGRGVPHVDVTAGSYVVGVLIGPTVGITGTISDILVNPFFKSIP